MNKTFVLLALLLGGVFLACNREDGQPDPPLQVLVPCDPAAPAGSPLSCPDLGVAGDGGQDAGAIDAGADATTDGGDDGTNNPRDSG